VEKDVVVKVMRSTIKTSLKDHFIVGNLLSLPEQVWGFVTRKSPVTDQPPAELRKTNPHDANIKNET
ncbi:MAG TPA: hypothetical protein VK616_02405, partial [Flavitalea sp.]|nr:hypothetical protein [Flavitalea sp.]